MGCRKSLDKKRGVSRFYVEDFLVSLKPKFSEGNPLLLHNFPVAKKFGEERGGGVSGFSVEIYLSHCAEIFRRGILYCCINFR